MAQKSIEELEKALFNNTRSYSDLDRRLVQDALNFSKNAHKGQLRRTGESYFYHPLTVAIYLSERDFDAATVAAGLLHDVMEDSNIEYNTLEKTFGAEIANIVEGITKISRVVINNKPLFFSPENYFAERVDNYRKLLLSTAKDIRVVIIKIFDRLHNIETIKGLPADKQRFYAIETIEIYAQIAERIGLSEVKRLLEEYAFPYAFPEEYIRYTAARRKMPRINKKFLDSQITEIQALFKREGLEYVDLNGRIKHDYSIHKKFVSRDYDFNNFYDLYALRVIVHNVSDCYKALGIIHSHFIPIPGRIFDSIAEPKPNGYQSLHTTVRIDGQPLEIQIRTSHMHQVAEYGPAAHWHYKEEEYGSKQKLEKSNKEWLSELSKIKNISDKKEFLSYLRNDLFAKKIFVLSPKGDIYNMPIGSTVIDFAYRIHSGLGEKLSGARINGEIAELGSRLKNGDVVEILTANRARPSIDWLRFAITSYARQKIKKYLRSLDYDKLQSEGEHIFNEYKSKNGLSPLTEKTMNDRISDSRLPYNNFSDLMVALAERVVTINMVIKVLYPNLKKEEVRQQKTIDNANDMKILSGIRYELAKCCQPKKDQKIVGYVGRDHIIRVHRANCKFIRNADPERMIYIDLDS